VLALYLSLTFVAPVPAASGPQDDKIAAKIRATLHERFPDVRVVSISAAAVRGLYEVVTAGEIVYTDVNADHLITGRIVDTRSRADVTAQRWDVLHSIDFNALPFDLAIKEVRGAGTRRLAIFEDPHCPYCAQLERDTQDLDDVTVYRFLFPLESLHPGAESMSSRIWCSKDPAAAWSAWMRDRTEPDARPCDNFPRKELAVLGEKLAVTGTPTTFAASGKRLFGAASTARIETLLGPR
jgi:thiol:disulfide interchange protein DsbC